MNCVLWFGGALRVGVILIHRPFFPHITPSKFFWFFRLSKQDKFEIGWAFANTTNRDEGSDSLPPVFYEDVVDVLVVASPKTANMKEKTGLSSAEERILRVRSRSINEILSWVVV